MGVLVVNFNLLLALLKAEVLPTIGSTELGAIALAAAYASDALNGKVDSIAIVVSANVYQNGAAVSIPGTGETGLKMAAALGAIKKQPEKQLSVLSNVTAEELRQGKKLLEKKAVTCLVDNHKKGLWIEVRLTSGQEYSHVIIKDKHTNVVSITKNGQFVFKQEDYVELSTDHRLVFQDDEVRISDMIATIEKMPWYEMEFLLDGVEMNFFAAEIGIARKSDTGIGALFNRLVSEGVLSNDIVNYAKMLSAAAADARMSGENIKIMSSAGSANHGIIAILPIYAVAKKFGVAKDRLAKAIAISHGITIYMKIHTEKLSAICDCAMAAAAGASAGITWLMNGNPRMIEDAMKNVIDNLAGRSCDGGKVGCALKLSTAAAIAVESSLLAQHHIVGLQCAGITGGTIEDIIKNLGQRKGKEA
jgi:L-cysteine desulfidase